jgi:CsoR family transcriptional regulator, copper-sensing transcriptional repressor
MDKPSSLQVKQLLNTAKGQLEAVVSMYEKDRYCVDIAQQLVAVQSLLKKINNLIIQDHIHTCVVDAIDDKEKEAKLSEISALLSKIAL